MHAINDVRQLTTSRRYYGHHHIPIQLNELAFDVTYVDYFIYDDRTHEFIVWNTYLNFVSHRKIINDATTIHPSIIINKHILGDSTNRKNSLR